MARKLAELVPGLALCAALAWAAVRLAESPWIKANLRFSALLIVILLGIALASTVRLPKILGPGLAFCQKPLLRWAVAGLGFKLSLAELAKIGGPALVVVVVGTCAALAFGWWLGLRLRLNDKLAILLSVGGAVCGASAVVAADTVVQADGEDAAVSLGVVTLWGTVGIFLFPLIGHVLAVPPFRFGVWTGASLQEMAQVVAAAQGLSDSHPVSGALDAVQVATVVKLARICLLAPIVLYLAWWLRRRSADVGEAKVAPVPWFLVMFLVFATVNSFAKPLGLTKATLDGINLFVTFLLATGMAGVGLKTGFRDVAKAGWRPVLLGLAQWAFLAVLAWCLTLLLGIA